MPLQTISGIETLPTAFIGWLRALWNFVNNPILNASTTNRASIRLPHGTAPTTPVNGDMWTTTAGLYVRINGVTVGPLS
jgi:hypothetical protein